MRTTARALVRVIARFHQNKIERKKIKVSQRKQKKTRRTFEYICEYFLKVHGVFVGFASLGRSLSRPVGKIFFLVALFGQPYST
jgi:hypothetical protein